MRHPITLPSLQHGKIGYVLAWLVGIPLPVLALFWLFFDR